MNILKTEHNHCWHAHRGPIWMVIPDGHMVQKCCKCPATRLIHVDHVHGYSRLNKDFTRWMVNGVPRQRTY